MERVDCDVDYEAPASVWAEESLTMLSAIDDSGNLHEELIDAIRDLVSGGVAVADGEDGFTIPDLLAKEIEVELSVFRYNPHERTSGTDTWLCSLKGHTTLLTHFGPYRELTTGVYASRMILSRSLYGTAG